jgi:hypothetical protein
MPALDNLHARLADLADTIDTTTEEGRAEAARVEELRAATVHLEAASGGDPLAVATKLLSWLDYYTTPSREPEVRVVERGEPRDAKSAAGGAQTGAQARRSR